MEFGRVLSCKATWNNSLVCPIKASCSASLIFTPMRLYMLDKMQNSSYEIDYTTKITSSLYLILAAIIKRDFLVWNCNLKSGSVILKLHTLSFYTLLFVNGQELRFALGNLSLRYRRFQMPILVLIYCRRAGILINQSQNPILKKKDEKNEMFESCISNHWS